MDRSIPGPVSSLTGVPYAGAPQVFMTLHEGGLKKECRKCRRETKKPVQDPMVPFRLSGYDHIPPENHELPDTPRPMPNPCTPDDLHH